MDQKWSSLDLAVQLESLKRDCSIHIKGALSREECISLMDMVENLQLSDAKRSDIEAKVIEQCQVSVFNKDVTRMLEAHFGQGYQIMWSSFDVVGDDAAHSYPSITWHLDGGVTGSLKLFVYLNSVEEHGCNTLMMDQERTNQLRKSGAFPISMKERKEDLTNELINLNLTPEYISYDLKAGDILLFSPLILAHRCIPPRIGKRRFTVCFTIIPAS
ncbi:hypothetical protein [Marinomonas balearica]|uniref:Phytanoyl-CoA dioxygenase PhyH n=1 Tax=Marinomonas balearica TaxID=491947 RepID=A0A4R6MC05_9GAMM|nr:hypothetical protein [Marinomonas balearica]TDO98655.1 hypothetical protein DFP79_1067 [Marinomonas balearica]